MIESISQLHNKRKKWVESSEENGFEEGIRSLLTNLYPDNAHFIFELLQNAEDAKATEVSFILFKDRLEFEHNGSKKFSFADIDSITSIGKSTKKDEETNIGKFGVGFKAVYAYTSKPEIISEDYHFFIEDMVVPTELEKIANVKNTTRFVFPFDNPSKAPDKAVSEIEKNLRGLKENTLLFLTSIKKIEYILIDEKLGFLERSNENEHIIKIEVIHPEDEQSSYAYFLRLNKSVDVLNEDNSIVKCLVSVAFGLDYEKTEERKKWKIIPLDPGQVSIYFPAEKETSKLHFHMHAPFASTVARDSIRDCEPNKILLKHLADLLCEALITIKKLGLLTVNFLSVLPNSKDYLSIFYQPILSSLIETFQVNDLTPMKNGGYAAASGVFKGKRNISDLITDNDLAEILGEDFSPPMWVANAPLRNSREDLFLSDLGISEWTESKLIDYLDRARNNTPEWLQIKIDEWFQDLYIVLMDYYNEQNKSRNSYNYLKMQLSKLKIIKSINGKLCTPDTCFFDGPKSYNNRSVSIVSEKVYLNSKDENKQKKAKDFLELVGVKSFGDKEKIQQLLKTKYNSVDKEKFSPQITDIKLFIKFIKNNPQEKSVFKDYPIFKNSEGEWVKAEKIYIDSPYLLCYKIVESDEWVKAEKIYIDSPYQETLLSHYFKYLDSPVRSLSLEYQELNMNEELVAFANSVGALTKLEMKKVSCWDNPDRHYLHFSSSGKGIGYDNDYTIEHIDDILKSQKDTLLSKLLWNTMNQLEDIYLKAAYQKSIKSGEKSAPSQLIHILREYEWIPQGNAFNKPSDSTYDNLPSDFTVEKNLKWLKDVEFQKNADLGNFEENQEKKSLEALRRTMGYKSVDALKDDLLLLKECKDDFEKFKNTLSPSFPTSKSQALNRRSNKIKQNYADLPEIVYEKKERSVINSSQADDIKDTYLRNLYTNYDDLMVCQLCHKEMPFKKRNGDYYFEAVTIFPNDYFKKHHHSRYIALCPVCSAKYKEFIKNCENQTKELRRKFDDVERYEFELLLGQEIKVLRFLETHLQDLKTFLEIEKEKPV